MVSDLFVGAGTAMLGIAWRMDPVPFTHFLAIRRLRALIRHLQEQQIRQLLDVVAEMHAVREQDVAVVSEFLGDIARAH